MFSEGDFNAPMLIHAQTPPGVPEMKRLKGKISYKFEQTKHGGLVRISTSDPQAVSAVHDFLPFLNPRASNRRPPNRFELEVLARSRSVFPVGQCRNRRTAI